MEQTTTATATATRPGFLTTLCILSFIGSGIWTLFSLLGIFASSWLMGMLGSFMSTGMEQAAATGEMSAEQVEQVSAASGMFATMGTGIIIAVCVVSLILSSLSLFGAIKMWGLKKSGFWLYTIPNGILFLLYLISFNIVGILITGGFIAMYAINKKHLTA